MVGKLVPVNGSWPTCVAAAGFRTTLTPSTFVVAAALQAAGSPHVINGA